MSTKPKTIPVRGDFGNTKGAFILGPTEAKSKQGGRTYVLARAEAKRVFTTSPSTFYGLTFYNKKQPIIQNYDIEFKDDGSVAFGCQVFGKTAVKALKAWAGVKA